MRRTEREAVQRRVPEQWTESQLCTWEAIAKEYNKVPIDGVMNMHSLLIANGKIFRGEEFNDKFVIDFYKHFESNLRAMMNVYEYEYVGSKNKNLKDCNNGISFDKYPFTLESMKEDLLRNGMYEPLFGYKNAEPGYIRICAGRHRLIAMESLYSENKWLDRNILCIFLDSHKEAFNCELVVPTIIMNKFFKNSNVRYVKLDDEFSRVYVNNAVDLWLIYKLQEKELNALVEKYEHLLLKYNIKASGIVNV